MPEPLHDKTFVVYSALDFEYSSKGRILNHFNQMPQRFGKSLPTQNFRYVFGMSEVCFLYDIPDFSMF